MPSIATPVKTLSMNPARAPDHPLAARSGLSAADFGAPLRDERVERLVDGGVHRRLLVFAERLLPDAGGALGRILAAAELPVLVVLPVGHQRPVERMLVTIHRVRLAEEVAAGGHTPDRVEAKLLLVDDDGL